MNRGFGGRNIIGNLVRIFFVQWIIRKLLNRR
jgi:hypothetical protein